MKNYREVAKAVIEPHLIVCNVCGKTIENDSFGYLDNYISIEKKWGYGTKFDGETHTLDFCISCYEKLLQELVVPPLNTTATR